MHRRWKTVLAVSIVLGGLDACRTSLPAGAPDVEALLRRRQLKLGKSTQERVTQVFGEPARQQKGLLSGHFRGGGSQTVRWVTLYYPQLGVECIILQTPAGPRLDEITLKPPYAKPVLDSVYLGRQRLGTLARGLRQSVWSTLDDGYLEPYEVRGGVSVGDMRLEAQVKLDSALWNRCQRRPALLDSLIGTMPVNQIVFEHDD